LGVHCLQVIYVDHSRDHNLCALEQAAADLVAQYAPVGDLARIQVRPTPAGGLRPPAACARRSSSSAAAPPPHALVPLLPHAASPPPLQSLARLVVQHLGGAAAREDELRGGWLQSSAAAKADARSIAIPLGSLTAGGSRHRALLFKLLADALGVRCQLVKGRFFGGSEDSSINMVTVGGQQYLLDLVSQPGRLVHPEEYATLARRGSGAAGGRLAARACRGCAAGCCGLHCLGCALLGLRCALLAPQLLDARRPEQRKRPPTAGPAVCPQAPPALARPRRGPAPAPASASRGRRPA
jgi:hypothetical protein